ARLRARQNVLGLLHGGAARARFGPRRRGGRGGTRGGKRAPGSRGGLVEGKGASAPDAERLRRKPAGEGALRPAGVPPRHAPHGQGSGGSRAMSDWTRRGLIGTGMTALAGGVLAA